MSDQGNNPWRLTPRQCEVLKTIGDGASNKVVARKLDMSERTVENHLYQAYKLMGVQTRVEAALYFDRWERQGDKR